MTYDLIILIFSDFTNSLHSLTVDGALSHGSDRDTTPDELNSRGF